MHSPVDTRHSSSRDVSFEPMAIMEYEAGLRAYSLPRNISDNKTLLMAADSIQISKHDNAVISYRNVHRKSCIAHGAPAMTTCARRTATSFQDIAQASDPHVHLITYRTESGGQKF